MVVEEGVCNEYVDRGDGRRKPSEPHTVRTLTFPSDAGARLSTNQRGCRSELQLATQSACSMFWRLIAWSKEAMVDPCEVVKIPCSLDHSHCSRVSWSWPKSWRGPFQPFRSGQNRRQLWGNHTKPYRDGLTSVQRTNHDPILNRASPQLPPAPERTRNLSSLTHSSKFNIVPFISAIEAYDQRSVSLVVDITIRLASIPSNNRWGVSQAYTASNTQHPQECRYWICEET